MSGPSVAVLGAGRLLGREISLALRDRQFPYGRLQLFETTELLAVGEDVEDVRCQMLATANLDDVDIVFSCLPAELSAEWVPRALTAGATVIDSSQIFAPRPDVPLIVPEVNAALLADRDGERIVASPIPGAVALSVALHPLSEAAGLERVVVASYESISTVDPRAVDELTGQVGALLNGRDADSEVFPHRMAFNVLPHVGIFLEGGQCFGEAQLELQVRKILDRADLAITAARALVPSFYGHAYAVHVQTSEPLGAEAAREILRGAPGVLLLDDPAESSYPTFVDAVNEDAVCIGRVRDDLSVANGLNLWVTIDETRKGGAVNAVQIGEILLRGGL